MAYTNSPGMNDFIQDSLDDTVFFYARRVVQRRGSCWDIYVDPQACLVSLKEQREGIPTVEELRQGETRKQIDEKMVIYDGKVLFSGGVILTINDKILMLFRDEEAPVDPLKWTSPAGRCDREPLLTSLKEFYEEVIVVDRASGNPIFITFPSQGYAEELKKIYAKTLRRKGCEPPVRPWQYLHADEDRRHGAHLREVRTYFESADLSDGRGSYESFKGSFFTFYNERENILEVRVLASLSIPAEMETRLDFRDGEEYERNVRLFSQEEFMLIDDASLVGTMVYFRDEVLKDQRL